MKTIKDLKETLIKKYPEGNYGLYEGKWDKITKKKEKELRNKWDNWEQIVLETLL